MLGKELLKIIEKRRKVKALTVSACLDPGFADPGSLGITLAARTGPAENRGLLSSHATTTPQASMVAEIWE